MSGVDREDQRSPLPRTELGRSLHLFLEHASPPDRRTRPGELIPVYLCCVCGARQAVHLKGNFAQFPGKMEIFHIPFEEELMVS